MLPPAPSPTRNRRDKLSYRDSHGSKAALASTHLRAAHESSYAAGRRRSTRLCARFGDEQETGRDLCG
jgi:hypothetical protein